MPRISGWGNHPVIDIKQEFFDTVEQAKSIVKSAPEIVFQGNLRSYGDCALNSKALNTQNFDYIFDFDKDNGVLHASSGVLLGELLNLVVKSGWFLAVVPGTKFVSIGGAIASNVHGKNHHINGCFSNYVLSFNLMLPSGDIVSCSKRNNQELFYATCGGMGLTGLILDVVIQLVSIGSAYLQQKTIKTEDIEETLRVMEDLRGTSYSVAWIDTSSKLENVGRAKINSAEFLNDANFKLSRKTEYSMPAFLPRICMSNNAIRAMNACFFSLPVTKNKVIDFDSFFFPLDAIGRWNSAYGKKGFIQYQFVVPQECALVAITNILVKMRELNLYSFLSVLKTTGKSNGSWLAFPVEGMSLALDFQYSDDLLPKLDVLDNIVVGYGGRLYLTKDCRMSKKTFENGYPNCEKFRDLRVAYGMKPKIESKQSLRLGI